MLALWMGASPLIPAAFVSLIAGRVGAFAAEAAAFVLYGLAATLARRAYLQPAPPTRRRFSRRLRLAKLNTAGLLTGIATALVAVLGAGYSLPIAVAFALVALSGFYLAYGVEPWLHGRALDTSDPESKLVAEALAEAEGRLIQIEQAATALGNPELRTRLARIATLGRDILAQIAARPSDLRRARRFLTVFLEGAEQVSNGYVRTHSYADSAELEHRFRRVLVTIEDQFDRQRTRLTQAEVLDLDVQIEVLQKQLEHEGIR